MTLARAMKWAHLALTLVWAVMIPVSFATGLALSVAWVTFLSLWALVVSHAAAFAASRAGEAAEGEG